MNAYLERAKLIEKGLLDADLSKSFERIDLENSVGFISDQNMSSGRCRVLIITDESIFTTVVYEFATLDNIRKKESILDYCNELNHTYKDMKFYLDESNKLVGQFAYLANPEHFDEELLIALLFNRFQMISDEIYSKVMRILWS